MTQVACFGPGSLYLTRTDVANSTPINIGYAQEFSLDEAADVKMLHGQNKYALVAAVGTVKCTGKIKAAMISGIALNNAFRGATFTSGQVQAVFSEAGIVPTTPFQITTSAGALTEADLGVVRQSDLSPYTKVASAPATGQYSMVVGTGIYTFAAADVTNAVYISYTKTVAGTGQKHVLANQAIGTNPTFQIDYSTSLIVAGTARPVFIRVYSCIASKLNQNFKLSDFMMPELDFTAYQNSAGNMYLISYPEVS